MTKFLGNVIRWFGLLAVIAGVVILFLLRANGAIAKQAGKDLSSPEMFVNPNDYILGYITGVGTIEPGRGRVWTVVSFKPSYTSLLYPDDQLLFCGRDAVKQVVKLTPDEEVAIVFSRAVSVAKVDGPSPNIIACHNLKAIRRVAVEP